MWTAGIVIASVVAITTLAAGIGYQRSVSAPVGEGQLFRAEASRAVELFSPHSSEPEIGVRSVRNELGIEAVALVDESGHVANSSAPEQVGDSLGPFLTAALSDGRFAAQATELTHAISIDTVVEWEAGQVLYAVVQPLADGRGLLLSYDISELLSRRSRSAAVRPLTIQLLIAAFVAAATAVGLWFARRRTRERIAEAQREADLLAAHATDLARHNVELDHARRRAERALAMAEETNRVRSEFVLMINHELRTPLTGVVTGAETLLDQPDLPVADRAEISNLIAADGRRLIELVSQMLVVARVENRSLDFTLSDFDVEQVVHRLEDRFETLTAMTETNVVVRSDPDTLTQILHTLVENAMSHGATRVSLHTRTSPGFEPDLVIGDQSADSVYLVVEDDGPGIDPGFLPRAFEKFEKRGRTSGTGLGLYLVRLMAGAVDAHLAVKTGPQGTAVAVGVPTAVVLETV